MNPEDYSRQDITTGRTILHDAAALGQCRIVKKVLKEGVNPALKDSEGRTALDLASIKRDNYC